MSEKIHMMVDLELNKVGCVIIQTAFGCGEANDFVKQAPDEDWSVNITPAMKRYSLTREQAQEYVNRLRSAKQ